MNGVTTVASRPGTPSWQAFQRMSSALSIAWDGVRKPYQWGDGGTAMDHRSGFEKNFLRLPIVSFLLLLASSLSAQTFNAPSAAMNLADAPKRSEQIIQQEDIVD
jgi:hypothetical protein